MDPDCGAEITGTLGRAEGSPQRSHPPSQSHPAPHHRGVALKEGLCWQWACLWTHRFTFLIFSNTRVNVKLACFLSPLLPDKKETGKNKANSTADNRLHTYASVHDSRGHAFILPPNRSCIFLDVTPMTHGCCSWSSQQGHTQVDRTFIKGSNARQMLSYARHTEVHVKWKMRSLFSESYGKDIQFFTKKLFSELPHILRWTRQVCQTWSLSSRSLQLYPRVIKAR